MSALAALCGAAPVPVLDAYRNSIHLLGGQPTYQRQRLAAAEAFLLRHQDLVEWMAGPVEARLAELHRQPLAWQLVAFAVLSGRIQADAEVLFAKNFGHNMPRWTAGLFPGDVRRLRVLAITENRVLRSPEVAFHDHRISRSAISDSRGCTVTGAA